jgi:hypothetical protein
MKTHGVVITYGKKSPLRGSKEKTLGEETRVRVVETLERETLEREKIQRAVGLRSLPSGQENCRPDARCTQLGVASVG